MKSKVELKPMKLEIELVPGTSWGNNVRSAVDAKTWDVIRRHAYAASGHVCSICGASGRLNCHEVWLYDDKKYIQKLVGFIALCDLCHQVKHLGRTIGLANRGALDYGAVVKHYMMVNQCAKDCIDNYYDAARAVHEKRSRHEWVVDLSFLDSIKLGVLNGN